ncbi:ARM repeat-containing protein [Rhizodiscina lignyota]|uniref:ARM repeat-containing protein n=1 Tax=Rhizodiscina lignyota TaxID=1504668 RepID=A0A9P4I4G4_9PEZI|nr:ARM repeat-containing protein [Rhizodiscina lignyota]
MFSSALKSFTSNISSNYSIAPNPCSFSGPWKIFDAKKKSTGKAVSVFVFDKKSLESQGGGLGGRSSASSLKRAHEEVVERLKRGASSLARLRHPSILELVEPVEETRNGGLMFATEQVTASLAGLLQEKDEQERVGGVGGRSSRYVVEESDGTRRRRELELDELEIQKGLLQIGKGLEFLHESASLVHGNLTPEAVFVNAKSDWKISGLGFSGPGTNSTAPSNSSPLSLSEALNHDPRLPGTVQLNLDYTSPDFVMDNNVSSAADMFSLGLLIIALYNSPHQSPLETHGSLSSYKRVFSSSSSVPNQSNNFLSASPIPKDLASTVLPRLITRRPAQRMTAREFQDSQYFDNILVSTIRFLDALPAKTPNEKAQFMRGLPRILNQFPKSVLEKKVLPALLEEMKDKELIALILQNVFKITALLPSGKRAFTEKAIPRLREVFLGTKAASAERDTSKEAGLMVLLDNMSIVAENSSGREFKDDILPIIVLAIESPTHSLVDASLRTLPTLLTVLDFTTVKNELFPVIAAVFSKTSSMGIKIRGLEAFQILCGGSREPESNDDLNGFGDPNKPKPKQNSVILDKYSIQEKIVPLLKAIKTKEPAVMIACLNVFREVGKIADTDFLAMDVLPILWNFSLGPLLNLEQFQAFMTLIKSLSARIEEEHTRKLRDLSANNSVAASRASDLTSFNAPGGSNGVGSPSNGEVDFESLVLGKKSPGASDMFEAGWDTQPAPASRPSAIRTHSQQRSMDSPSFSWSTPTSPPAPKMPALASAQPSSRTITPDQSLGGFAALTPASSSANTTSFSQSLQPSRPTMMPTTSASSFRPSMSSPPITTAQAQSPIDWSGAVGALSASSGWGTQSQSQSQSKPPQTSSMTSQFSSFSVSPPPTSPYSGFGIAPPPKKPHPATQQQPQLQQMGNSNMQGQKSGLDKYESLL